jgi:membrane protease YdiL (CAAX protease family)
MASTPSLFDKHRVHLRAFGGSLAVILLVLLIAGIAVALADPLLSVFGVDSDSALGRAAISAAQFIGFGIAGGGYALLTDQRQFISIELPSRSDMLWIGIGIVTLLALFGVVSGLFSLLGIESADSAIVEQGQDNPVYFLYLIPITIFLVGPTEELIFRGIIQGHFREAYGSVVAVITASSIFAVIHFSSYQGNGLIATLTTIMILGSTLGVIYERTRNLVVPAVVHGLFNTVQFFFVYASITTSMG